MTTFLLATGLKEDLSSCQALLRLLGTTRTDVLILRSNAPILRIKTHTLKSGLKQGTGECFHMAAVS